MNQEIVQCLVDTLNPDGNTRVKAELRLAELIPTPEAGLALSTILVAQDADIALRQISRGIVLKKYVTERWSPFFPSFRGSAPSPEVKSQIRAAVFSGLTDPQRKIRSSCAFVISSVAHCDWPEEYPTLLTDLIGLLSLPSPPAVHGALQVFTEFISSDLTEDQILPVLRQLLPILLNILGSTENSPFTRARAVAIFRQCTEALYMVKDLHSQAVKEAVSTVMPTWLDAFRVLLELDPTKDVADGNNWDALAIRIQIVKTLNTIRTCFPAVLKTRVHNFLPLAVMHLNALLPTFTAYYLTNTAEPPPSSPDDPDMQVSLSQLGCPLLDFISQIIRVGKAKELLEQQGALGQLLGVVLAWVAMTEEDEESWTSNVNLFLSDEDDETDTYTLRVAGLNLISMLLETMPAQTTKALQEIITTVSRDSLQAKQSGVATWWRSLEACLASIDANAILDVIEAEEELERPKSFDVESLLSGLLPSLLTETSAPFLQGRAFVLASQFTKAIPLALASQYLTAAVTALESPELSAPVKVSAVKAIRNFYSELDDSSLTDIATKTVQSIAPFLLVTSEDTLTLVLEALVTILEVDEGKWLTVDLAGPLVTASLEVWQKNIKDRVLMSALEDVLTALASSTSPGVYQCAITLSLPIFTGAMANASPEDSWIASSAIELVSSLLRGAKSGEVGNGFFAVLGPALFTTIRNTQDREVLQNGTECLTLMIRKDHQQLLNWSDPEGQTGLNHVLALLARTLQPDDKESGGLIVGELIIHLLRRAGDSVIPVLPDLLQAMVIRITTAKTATFLQSLIIPFAFLLHVQRDTVLDLLESITIPGSNPPKRGLEVLLEAWCENAETFHGAWAIRTSNLGLCHLFVSDRQILRTIHVRGDLIVNPETANVIVTRSRAKKTPHQYTSVPFPLKALKLVLLDLHSGGDAATITARNAGDVDSDDGDDEWADEESGIKEEELAFLSDILGPNFENDDFDTDRNDDEDLKDDPILQMDMKEHLLGFLRECAARNTNDFASIVDQMNTEEILVIRRAVNTPVQQ